MTRGPAQVIAAARIERNRHAVEAIGTPLAKAHRRRFAQQDQHQKRQHGVILRNTVAGYARNFGLASQIAFTAPPSSRISDPVT